MKTLQLKTIILFTVTILTTCEILAQAETQNGSFPFWKIKGNSATNSGSNFLGTTDFVSLRIRTNNTERMVIDSNGLVGIGIVSPVRLLHLGGTANTLRVGGLATGGSFITAPAASTDKILFADANGDVRALANGSSNQALTINASGVPGWTNGNFWSLSGNSLTGTEIFGSTNAQVVKFYCNNIERMRINPTDGEIVAGATGSPYAGDMVAAVASAALTFAVNGYSAQNGSGTWGEVLAASTTAFSAIQGVYGGSGAGAGALGNYNGTSTVNTRSGVYGVCSTPAATNAGAGVVGYNAIASGNQHMGVLGYYNSTSYGIGVYGIAAGGGIVTGNNDIGVVGWRTNNQNYSGYFNGNHVIANGTKSASVGTSKSNQLLYVNESPEVWFEDFGEAKLANGTCTVNLDPLFLETVFIDASHPMHVFIQMEGEAQDVYVQKGTTSFTVKEKNGGNSNASFSWRLVAKRLNFQDHRFGCDPLWGGGDTRKYNQYAPPPPIDYNENVKFQEELKRNYKPTPMPQGFIDYFQLQKEAQSREVTKPTPKK